MLNKVQEVWYHLLICIPTLHIPTCNLYVKLALCTMHCTYNHWYFLQDFKLETSWFVTWGLSECFHINFFIFQILGQGLCCAEGNKDWFLQGPKVVPYRSWPDLSRRTDHRRYRRQGWNCQRLPQEKTRVQIEVRNILTLFTLFNHTGLRFTKLAHHSCVELPR